jgi:RNA polymerase sigma factor (sigma-70 family)
MADRSKNIVQAVRDYGKRLFYFIRGRVTSRQDAEDILQDIWYQLSNMANVEEIQQMSGWLFRVARNKIIDRRRKKTVASLESLNDSGEQGHLNVADILMINEGDPETEYLKDVFWQELFAALEELPENQKQVFIQNELEDKTLQQIADETGENLKTVISRKGYAVKYLRKRLGSLYNEFLEF